MPICDFCFRDKLEVVKPIPKAPVNVCKACNFELNKVIGFLRKTGASVYYQPKLDEATTKQTPPNPPRPSRKKAKPDKETPLRDPENDKEPPFDPD